MAKNLPTNCPSSEKTMKDLLQERSKATFNTLKITNLLDGSQTATTRRQHLESLIANDPTGIFSNEQNSYMHRSDRHIRSLAKHVRLMEICRSIGIGERYNGEIVLDPDLHTLIEALADDLPTYLHWVMFVPNILSLCDEEQQARWLPLCRDWKMIGCYAQTELGHGSNVRALETTATFLKEEDGGDPGGSWIIHSPTLTSIKFWPGTLGRTGNHAMVIARLIDGEGVDHGVHNFLVQTRSYKDHTLMKGVTCGDIGPKIGYNVMDNGFAKFDKVKIPRRNMAMRFAVVDEQGNYSKKTVSEATSKISYITMMQVRAMIVRNSSKVLRMGSTMAIRYSAVRRQGFKDKHMKEENQILDYKQQQHRLFPLLAASYCFFFTAKKLSENLKAIEERLYSLSNGDSSNVDVEEIITKIEVGGIHASTSALKSFCTTVAADGIEDMRKACGGHGFLQASGFPEMICAYLQNPTVEGDNQMLPMQVVKVLLKLVKDVKSGNAKNLEDWSKTDAKYLIEPLQEMVNGNTSKACNASSKEEMMDASVLRNAYQHRAARLLFEVSNTIEQDVKNGKKFEDAWNSSLIQMGRISKAHCAYLLFDNFMHGIKEENQKDNVGPAEEIVLKDLAMLYGSYWIEKEIGDFLEDKYFTSEHAAYIRSLVLEMMDKIRPNSVALVDAFDISDFRLKSALGKYDGDVYPAIVKAAKRDPLNASEPGPGYKEHLKDLIVGGVGVYSGTISRL